jgi:hypothetical protein
LLQLIAVHRHLVSETAALEILRGDSSHAIRVPSVPINIYNIRVPDDCDVPKPAASERPTIPSATIPGVEGFERSQRAPSHMPESNTNSNSAD